MVKPAKTAIVPAGWDEVLACSKAYIAAGETEALLPVLDRLRASAERLEAAQVVPSDPD